MGHLQTIESELRQVIATGDSEALVAWVKDRVLESYRNGQAGARKPSTSPRVGKAPARASVPANLPV